MSIVVSMIDIVCPLSDIVDDVRSIQIRVNLVST